MRIIAGDWRGRRLAALGKGDAGAHLRPTPDRVRESLFSMLAARGVIEDARVLDLFAGTGALAFEALSRGAASACLVENGRVGQRLIAENIATLDANATLIKRDATRLASCEGPPFTLVFLDPPYGKDLGAKALNAARDAGWLAPGAVIVWEENAPMTPPAQFDLTETRRFGDTYVTLMTVEGERDEG